MSDRWSGTKAATLGRCRECGNTDPRVLSGIREGGDPVKELTYDEALMPTIQLQAEIKAAAPDAEIKIESTLCDDCLENA